MSQVSDSTLDKSVPQGTSGRAFCTNGELVRMFARKLEGRGLDFRLVTYPGDVCGDEHIEELVVTNPAALERGEIRISDDGSLTWEYFGKLDKDGAARILDDVTNALRATGVRFRHGPPS